MQMESYNLGQRIKETLSHHGLQPPEGVDMVEWLCEENERLKLNIRFTCGVCWTSSYVPVPDKDECGLNHPHEGDHARCDQCWLKGLYVALESRLALAREAMKEAYHHLRVIWTKENVDAVRAILIRALRALEEPK